MNEPVRITPAYIEALIDEAGRDIVFARARELGWGDYCAPPLWVWNQICADILRERRAISAILTARPSKDEVEP